MKNNDLVEAKRIFLKYNGSYFHMEREGVYNYYKGFNISKNRELLWINEYVNSLLLKIKSKKVVDDSLVNLSAVIRQYKQKHHFEQLLSWAKINVLKADSFTNLRIAEEILSIVEVYKQNQKESEIVKEAIAFSSRILHDTYKYPITVAQYYKDIDYLIGCLDSDTIKKRVKMRLEEWSTEIK